MIKTLWPRKKHKKPYSIRGEQRNFHLVMTIKLRKCVVEPKAKFTYSLSESESEDVSNIATDILNILLEANL